MDKRAFSNLSDSYSGSISMDEEDKPKKNTITKVDKKTVSNQRRMRFQAKRSAISIANNILGSDSGQTLKQHFTLKAKQAKQNWIQVVKNGFKL